MSRLRVLACLAAAAALVCAATATAQPSARAAAKCDIRSKQRKLGPTYVLSLSVSKTSCRTGQRVVTAYYRCRIKAGGKKGRCHSSVLGYRCSERRSGIKTEFDAKVSCKKGSARVDHTYTQFT